MCRGSNCLEPGTGGLCPTVRSILVPPSPGTQVPPQRFQDLVRAGSHPHDAGAGRRQDRVAQAYLFAGPRGSGKTTTARLIAKALNCERRSPVNPSPATNAGAASPSPRAIPSTFWRIDGASNRGIGGDPEPPREREVRGVRRGIQGLHHRRGAPADRLRVERLLKTLEEPPAHVKFVFCNHRAARGPGHHRLPLPGLRFRRLRSEELVKHLLDVAGRRRSRLIRRRGADRARLGGERAGCAGRLDQALAVSPTASPRHGRAGAGLGDWTPTSISARRWRSAIQDSTRGSGPPHDAGSDVERSRTG